MWLVRIYGTYTNQRYHRYKQPCIYIYMYIIYIYCIYIYTYQYIYYSIYTYICIYSIYVRYMHIILCVYTNHQMPFNRRIFRILFPRVCKGTWRTIGPWAWTLSMTPTHCATQDVVRTVAVRHTPHSAKQSKCQIIWKIHCKPPCQPDANLYTMQTATHTLQRMNPEGVYKIA